MSKYQEDEQYENAMAIENDKDNGVITHKTPIYQRKANKAYYLANRDAILEKKRNKSPKAVKGKKNVKDIPIVVTFE